MCNEKSVLKLLYHSVLSDSISSTHYSTLFSIYRFINAIIRLVAIFFISYTADLSLGIVVGAFFIDILLNHSSLSFHCSFLLLLSRLIGGLFLVFLSSYILFNSLQVVLHLHNGVLFHYSINSNLHMSYPSNHIHS